MFKRAVTLLALLIFGISMTVSAQSPNGTVAGTVVDSTGAAIVNASVTITDVQTGIGRTVTTNKAGGYRIESVQPGTYKVVVTAPSFASTTIERKEVVATAVTSVNATLNPGSAAATVEVGAETTGLQTENGELSNTISVEEVQNLPIASLNPYSLALTLPGVTAVTQSDFTNGTSFSANGLRPRDNNFLMEGSDNNDQGLHGQAFQPNNLEAIQEVTFLLSSFSPEYGGGGSVSNVILQSGSNSFHGAVFERILNSSLDSKDKNDIINNVPKGKSRENLYGFRIGGPIIRDRAFFFVSNQWDKFRATANLGILELPTAQAYTVLQSLAASNPRVTNLLQAYGGLVGVNPNYTTTVDLGAGRGTVNFEGYQRSLGEATNGRELEATSDVKLNESDKLRFRFIQSPYSAPYDVFNFPNQLPKFDTLQNGTVYNAGIVETHVFSPSVVNEIRLQWDRIGFNFDLRPETYANPLALAPAISISGVTGYGIPAGTVPQGRFQDTYQLQDSLSYNWGRHDFRVGFDIEDIRIKDSIPFNFYGSIPYSKSLASSTTPGYSALANYIDDYSGTSQNSAATIAFGNPVARPTIWSQSYFVEDAWKVMPNFSVDLGLRYEFHGAPFNYLGYPAFDPNNPAAFPNTVKEVSDKNNIAPRIGFNYQPVVGGKTAISGGFGIFYSHVFSNVIDNIQGSAPNTASKAIYPSASGRGTPNWSQILTVCSTCAITTTAPQPKDTANVINANLVDPMTYEWNFRVQRQLPAAFTLSAGYVGTRTEKDYATEEFNPSKPSGGRVVPTRGRIIVEDNGADSNYNSGEFTLEHKGAHGLTMRAAYTYSKMMDDGSEVFTSGNESTYAEIQRTPRGREYARSAFDHKHRIVVSAVYAIPKWNATGSERFAAAIVNGFTFATITSFQSGNPINVEIGYDWNLDGIGNDRPILVNKNAPITNWAIKGEDFFNVAPGTLCDGPAFWATNDDCHVVSAANTHWVTSNFGTTQNTVSRNYLTSDHISNTDLTVQRSFKTFEHQSFDFRAEALNVFNQGNTGNFNASLISGVPYNGTDSLGNVYSGRVTFDNRYLTVSGSRTLRFFARYQF